MATTVHDIHNIVDNMYNARSEFRSMYLNLSSGNLYTLETKITKAITKAVDTNKIDLDINLKEFYISIVFTSEELAKKLKTNVEVAIDGALRDFLTMYYTGNQQTKEYLDNSKNKLMDIYTVGQSIKILV